MYVRGYDDSKHDLLSYSDLYPDCPSSMTAAQCEELNHAPPSLADNSAASPNTTAHWNTTRVAAPAPHASAKPDVIAADITRFGQRNFIGVVVLALVGAGAAFFLLKKGTSDEEGEDGAAEEVHAPAPPKRDPKTPPTFLPMDAMVVNLADPGGNRFAQLAITLQLDDPTLAQAQDYITAGPLRVGHT